MNRLARLMAGQHPRTGEFIGRAVSIAQVVPDIHASGHAIGLPRVDRPALAEDPDREAFHVAVEIGEDAPGIKHCVDLANGSVNDIEVGAASEVSVAWRGRLRRLIDVRTAHRPG